MSGGYSGATEGWRIITGRSSLTSLLLATVLESAHFMPKPEAYLPMPIASLTPSMQRTSKRDPADLPPSPCLCPPFTPRACLGTSTTRFATPSTPGGMMYSGPRKETMVTVSDSCSGCFWFEGMFGKCNSRVKVTDSPVF